MDAALPVLEAANKALNCITRNDITYLKKLPQPPEDVKMVLAAVSVLMGLKAERKMDPNTQKPVFDFWPTAVKMMNKDAFLKDLTEYDKENIDGDRIKKLQEFLTNPKFNLEHLKTISEIAANLASWAIAMGKYYEVNLVIKPKKIGLAKAQAEYEEVAVKLRVKQEELRVVQEKVDLLRADLKETQDKKE